MAIRLARARVSLATGDRETARAVVGAAMAALESRAARIGDASWRAAAFLSGVPEHAEIARLRAWLL